MQNVVGPNHPSAPATYGPSRDMQANFGVGTLRREDANMLSSRPVAVSLAGMTQPKWHQSRAVEVKGGVLPKSRAMDVVARSGNQDNLASVGFDVEADTQVGAGTPAPAFDFSLKNPWIKNGAIFFGTYILITKFIAPKLFR